jgi:hypothetical protein
MPRRFPSTPEHLREPHELRWSDFPALYWKVIGITVLIGLLTGSMWIAWKLLVFRFGH